MAFLSPIAPTSFSSARLTWPIDTNYTTWLYCPSLTQCLVSFHSNHRSQSPGLVVTAFPIHRNVYKHLSAKMSKYISVILFNWNMRTTNNDSILCPADTITSHVENALLPGESPITHILWWRQDESNKWLVQRTGPATRSMPSSLGKKTADVLLNMFSDHNTITCSIGGDAPPYQPTSGEGENFKAALHAELISQYDNNIKCLLYPTTVSTFCHCHTRHSRRSCVAISKIKDKPTMINDEIVRLKRKRRSLKKWRLVGLEK